ncbi:MAG TPA: LemA family protein [Steroidobacteraceae bacterium]|jgi:LemA protein
MMTGLVLAVLLVLAIGYFVGLYNGLVRVRADVKLAWSNIDVLLVQRHDELPKLVETCKQYLQYEQHTLERVMEARSAVASARASGSVAAVGAAESGMRSGLAGLFAVAERYPNLKADEAFRHLQQRITGLEQAIADRREIYNEAVNINNVRVVTFPDSLIATRYGFNESQLLKFEAAQKADVDLKAQFAAG